MGKLMNAKGSVLSNERVGRGISVMEIACPPIAATIGPGQFVHLLVPGMEAHILRRPFSAYTATPATGTVEVLYQVVGFGSAHMAGLVLGDAVELIGPVGTGWQPPAKAKRALLVGGGVGAAPLLMLAQELCARGVPTDVVLGAQTEHALVCRRRFEGIKGCTVRCATDDGSFGHAGLCTPLIEDALAEHEYGYVAVCGPEPLMRIGSHLAIAAGLPCEVSLERRMACGIGACLGCAVDTDGGRKRACVDGPVFDARKVVW